MTVMETPPAYTKSLYVRTTLPLKASLKHVLADLQAAGVTCFGEPVSQEALVNASWLWMESIGTEALAESLAPHLARVERMTVPRVEPGNDAGGRVAEAADSKPRRRRDGPA